jgi:hypothetical protein
MQAVKVKAFFIEYFMKSLLDPSGISPDRSVPAFADVTEHLREAQKVK